MKEIKSVDHLGSWRPEIALKEAGNQLSVIAIAKKDFFIIFLY